MGSGRGGCGARQGEGEAPELEVGVVEDLLGLGEGGGLGAVLPAVVPDEAGVAGVGHGQLVENRSSARLEVNWRLVPALGLKSGQGGGHLGPPCR